MIATARWHEALRRALGGGERAVLVVVATANGSTPREPGAAMAVTASAVAGTIGGGHLEYEALRIARDALATVPPSAWAVRFPLSARLGQCCGGVATLAFATFDREATPWLDAAMTCARTGVPFAVVTPVHDGGVASSGRLLVTSDDARGTLGARALDSAAIALARTRLATTAPRAALVPFAHDVATTLLVQVERPDPFVVMLFGNGHVGRALVDVLGTVPVHVKWIDSRGADFPARVPANVEITVTDAPEDELIAAPPAAFVVVTTHSHAIDFALIEQSLARDDWRYVGLIGSASKRAQFERRLAARGWPADAFAHIHCPIGARGIAIGSKHPGAIAIAIAAELLVVREAGATTTALRMASR
jgi:xanthine dehydrogenase accessory factor